MRRFRYNVNQALKIIMTAAGGVLILALAGTGEKELGGEQKAAVREYGRELLKDGVELVVRRSYPRTMWEKYKGDYGGKESGQEDDRHEGLAMWLRNRDPRIRFYTGYQEEDAGRGDPDPSFAGYLESQRVVAESGYLLFGGDEETGTDKADMAGIMREERGEGNFLADGTQVQGAESVAGEEKSGVGSDQVKLAAVANLTAGTAAYHTAEGLPLTGTGYVLEQLADYDFLMKHFYSVHSSTTAGRDEMDAARLLGEDLSIEKDAENPQILIYHTHSQETYADYGPDNPQATVVDIGNYLTELLEARGYNVIHNTQAYDTMEGELNRSKAYDYALDGITAVLQENPSVQVVLDIHRDGVREDLHMVSEINGKPTAPIMFFNGMSQTPEGPIAYLPNGYKEQNLAFSLQMQLDAAAYFPGFTRKIYLKAFRYNLHLRPRSALIEVGAQTNTWQEARNAMEPLAELLDMVLSPAGSQ